MCCFSGFFCYKIRADLKRSAHYTAYTVNFEHWKESFRNNFFPAFQWVLCRRSILPCCWDIWLNVKGHFCGVKYRKIGILSKTSFLKALECPKLNIDSFIGKLVKRWIQNMSPSFCSMYRCPCSGRRKRRRRRKMSEFSASTQNEV